MPEVSWARATWRGQDNRGGLLSGMIKSPNTIAPKQATLSVSHAHQQQLEKVEAGLTGLQVIAALPQVFGG